MTRIKGKVCCPIHKEKTPSMVLLDDQTIHCFGCNANGIWSDSDNGEIALFMGIGNGKATVFFVTLPGEA